MSDKHGCINQTPPHGIIIQAIEALNWSAACWHDDRHGKHPPDWFMPWYDKWSSGQLEAGASQALLKQHGQSNDGDPIYYQALRAQIVAEASSVSCRDLLANQSHGSGVSHDSSELNHLLREAETAQFRIGHGILCSLGLDPFANEQEESVPDDWPSNDNE